MTIVKLLGRQSQLAATSNSMNRTTYRAWKCVCQCSHSVAWTNDFFFKLPHCIVQENKYLLFCLCVCHCCGLRGANPWGSLSIAVPTFVHIFSTCQKLDLQLLKVVKWSNLIISVCLHALLMTTFIVFYVLCSCHTYTILSSYQPKNQNRTQCIMHTSTDDARESIVSKCQLKLFSWFRQWVISYFRVQNYCLIWIPFLFISGSCLLFT